MNKKEYGKKRFREIKEEFGCVDCGKNYPHWMLDFDHLPQYNRIGSPQHMASRGLLDDAFEELKKCDVVCPNCHRVRTVKRREHGWRYAYDIDDVDDWPVGADS